MASDSAGPRDSPFYDVAGSLASVPARQGAGVVMHRLPAAPWGEQCGAASTGGSPVSAFRDLRWIQFI